MVRMTVNTKNQSKLGLPTILTLTIILKLAAQQSDAYYPGPRTSHHQQQQAISTNPNYYNLEQTNGLQLPSLAGGGGGNDGANIGQLMESAKYQLVPQDTSDQLSSYLLPDNGENLPTLDQLDIEKLVAYLTQLQGDNSGGENSNENSAIVASGDLNSHLSPTDPLANTISGPVNDPADFEAVLSQLTNTINHELPNSSNRSAILDSLLSVYLGNIMQQLKQQQQHQETDTNNNDDSSILFSIGNNDDKDNDNSMATTEAELVSLRGASSAAPISRYGNGEYIDHPLALIGHQYVQGGAGEGRQLLGPDGAFENVQVVKSDHAVPSYCDPPNPCPIGYTAEDGCLEKFVNSASFSREYQVKQQCSCDNEHSLFNCASPVSTIKSQVYTIPSSSLSAASIGSPLNGNQQQVNVEGDGQATSHSMIMNTGNHNGHHGMEQQQHPISDSGDNNSNNNNWLETLARTIQNRFGGLASVRNLIGKHENEALIGQQAIDDENDEQYSNNIVKKGFQIGSNFKY